MMDLRTEPCHATTCPLGGAVWEVTAWNHPHHDIKGSVRTQRPRIPPLRYREGSSRYCDTARQERAAVAKRQPVRFQGAGPCIQRVQLKVFSWTAGANESRSIRVYVGVQKGVLGLFKPLTLPRLHRRIFTCRGLPHHAPTHQVTWSSSASVYLLVHSKKLMTRRHNKRWGIISI